MFDPFASNTGKRVGRDYVTPIQAGMAGLVENISGGDFGGKSVGRGTVIPRHKAGRGGGSMGYDPHRPPHKHVIIDPHVAGRAVALDLGKVVPEQSEEAYRMGMEFANEIMDDPPDKMDGIEMTDDEGPRLGAYAAVRILTEKFGASPDSISHTSSIPSVAAGSATRVPSFASTGATKAASFGVPTIGDHASEVHVISGRPAGAPTMPAGGEPGPMARFRPAPAPAAGPATRPARQAEHPRHEPGPPGIKVIFDFGDQVGQFPASYHEVIRARDALILAWDTRWEYGDPYSPEALTQEFAVQVEGDPEVHLVMSDGGTFACEFKGFRLFHLGIVQSVPADKGVGM